MIDGVFILGVEYKGKGFNGDQPLRETYKMTGAINIARINQVIKNRLSELGTVVDIVDSLPAGEFTPPTDPVVTPPVEVPPTAEETALIEKKALYRDKIRELSKKKNLVDLGVIDDKDLDALRAEVKTLATELNEI